MTRIIVTLAALAMMVTPALGLPLVVNGDFNDGDMGWTQFEDINYGSGSGINSTVSSDIGGYPETLTNAPYGATTFWSNMGHSSWGSAGRYQVVDVSGYENQPLTLKFWAHWHNHGETPTWHEWGVIDGTDTDPNTLPGTGVWLIKKVESDDNYPPDWIQYNLDFTPTQSTVTVYYKAGTHSGGAVITRADNFVITPEPTGLALLAFGFLPLLRRRR